MNSNITPGLASMVSPQIRQASLLTTGEILTVTSMVSASSGTGARVIFAPAAPSASTASSKAARDSGSQPSSTTVSGTRNRAWLRSAAAGTSWGRCANTANRSPQSSTVWQSGPTVS